VVYGFDTNGLYNLWREDNGLPTLEFVPIVDGTSVPVAEGTRAPLSIPTSIGTAPRSGTDSTSGTPISGGASDDLTTSEGSRDSSGTSAGLIVAIVTGLIVITLAGAAITLFRKRPSDA
jgi:hypothetical protein